MDEQSILSATEQRTRRNMIKMGAILGSAGAAGGFRREVQPRRQHWFLNEKSGFPFRTPAFCSVSRGQRRLGEKEYRAPSVTQGVALRPRTQGGPSISPGRPWLSRSWRMGPGDFRSTTFLSVSPDLLAKTDIPASPSWLRDAIAKALSETRAMKAFSQSVELGHNDYRPAH